MAIEKQFRLLIINSSFFNFYYFKNITQNKIFN